MCMYFSYDIYTKPFFQIFIKTSEYMIYYLNVSSTEDTSNILTIDILYGWVCILHIELKQYRPCNYLLKRVDIYCLV